MQCLPHDTNGDERSARRAAQTVASPVPATQHEWWQAQCWLCDMNGGERSAGRTTRMVARGRSRMVAHTGAGPGRLEGAELTNLGPSSLGHGSEPKDEVSKALQQRTVEAMCKANWPAQWRLTEAVQATWS
jgi:hypothetical protein